MKNITLILVGLSLAAAGCGKSVQLGAVQVPPTLPTPPSGQNPLVSNCQSGQEVFYSFTQPESGAVSTFVVGSEHFSQINTVTIDGSPVTFLFDPSTDLVTVPVQSEGNSGSAVLVTGCGHSIGNSPGFNPKQKSEH